MGLLPAGFGEGLGGLGKIGKIGKGLGYGIGGDLLAGFAKDLGAPSEVSGALKGAGFGAGIGSFFPGPGTLIGGGVGAIAGLADDVFGLGLFGGGNDTPDIGDLKHTIRKASRGLSPIGQQTLLASMHSLHYLPKDQRAAALQQLTQQLPGVAVQDSQQQAQQQIMQRSYATNSKWLAKRAEGTAQLGHAQAQAIRALIPRVAPEYQPILELDAMNRETQARQLANAYVQSFVAEPIAQSFQAQLAQLRGAGGAGSANGASTSAYAASGY